ncbi:MAG: hypothetical protein AAFQ47_16410 [Pseudomonadota bacterium]
MQAVFEASGHMAGVAPDETVNYGNYMQLADARLNLFSVFDDLRYDRSDIDMLSPAMRRHAIERLAQMGFKQISGRVLENKRQDIRCHIPKFHALGSSPFDITRDTPKRERDYYVMTPTQTACQFIDTYPLEEAITKIETLITVQPINLYKMKDYLEDKQSHRDVMPLLGHLMAVQKEAVSSAPLRGRRALGSLM